MSNIGGYLPHWIIFDRVYGHHLPFDVRLAPCPGMISYAVESGSELSYGDAAGTSTMPETVTVDRPPAAKAAATVSASALALHLDCTPTSIAKLEAEGVIQRQGDGFPLDQSRVAYLRHLRRERRQSPRAAADAEPVAAKAALLRIRIAEKTARY